MRRKREDERKARELARLLVALDETARLRRPWQPRRPARAALGRLR